MTQHPLTLSAPLTRRQAREIERRTGVRPVAIAPARSLEHDFRHDTGEISRNEVGALLSVIPAELADVLARPAAPVVDQAIAPAAPAGSAFAGRSASVRAVVPAELVALRRRRALSGVAAAASVSALATVGLAGTVNAVSADAHQADLAAAVDSSATQTATDVVVPAPATADTALSPAPAVVAESTSVASFEPGAVVAAAVAPAAETPAPTTGAVTAVASTTMHAPIAAGATITDGFGPRVAPIAGASTNHRGIDLVTGATCGTEIYAVMSGTVVAAGWNGTYGNTIDITAADGTMFRFAHLDSINVGVGATVSGGDVIGLGGSTGASTGCHLHFEVFENGENVDPQAWLTDRGLF